MSRDSDRYVIQPSINLVDWLKTLSREGNELEGPPLIAPLYIGHKLVGEAVLTPIFDPETGAWKVSIKVPF